MFACMSRLASDAPSEYRKIGDGAAYVSRRRYTCRKSFFVSLHFFSFAVNHRDGEMGVPTEDT